MEHTDRDFEWHYRAVDSRDARFDGWFVTAVTSTGIYCRPSCPAITPKRSNVRFLPSPAAAQREGFRACLRCRPDAAPGSPQWNYRADVVGRAMRLIADGIVDRDGVPGLAAQLGYTERHLGRLLQAEVGASPLALARAQRAQTARVLIETTSLGLTEIAFAAGFGSVRQFNETTRDIYGRSPTELRRGRRDGQPAPAGPDAGLVARRPANRPYERDDPRPSGLVCLRLPFREPLNATALLDFLAHRTIAGVDEVEAGVYRRAIRLPHGDAIVALEPLPGFVKASLHLADLRDLAPAVSRCRRLLDLDADPVAVDAVLAADPALAPSVAKDPGVRVPGAVDGFEIAVRAIVGQQISVAGARSVLARLVRVAAGDRDGLTPFPTAAQVAAAPDEAFGMPAARRQTIRTLAEAVASQRLRLDPGADRAETEAALVALPGIGPWTAQYVALRALGDPDVLMATDLGVRRGAAALGLPTGATALIRHSLDLWAPWRSYATIHLWRHA